MLTLLQWVPPGVSWQGHFAQFSRRDRPPPKASKELLKHPGIYGDLRVGMVVSA